MTILSVAIIAYERCCPMIYKAKHNFGLGPHIICSQQGQKLSNLSEKAVMTFYFCQWLLAYAYAYADLNRIELFHAYLK